MMQTPKKHKSVKEREESPTGVQLWLVLMKAFHALSAFASETLRNSGLSDSEFRVLEALLHKGKLPVNEIGAKVFLAPGTVSVAVDKLLRLGFVTRVEDKDDRRIRRVDLTTKGRTLIEHIFAAHAARMNELIEVLSPKEARRLADALKTLGKSAASQLDREPGSSVS